MAQQHQTRKFSMIVAMTPERVIGVGNTLPWHLPEDLKYFREKTRGHHVIMGRKTFDSIGRPLPGRPNFVVTRDPNARIEGTRVFNSLETAMAAAAESDDLEPFVLGGGLIYEEAFRLDAAQNGRWMNRLYITLVNAKLRGDAYFPAIDQKIWKLVSEDPRKKDERHNYDYNFQVYEKV